MIILENKYARAKTWLQTVSMLAERSEINYFLASIANSLTDALQREHICFPYDFSFLCLRRMNTYAWFL